MFIVLKNDVEVYLLTKKSSYDILWIEKADYKTVYVVWLSFYKSKQYMQM